MKHPRFIVGIDLGTTTTSLSYIDTLSESKDPKSLAIAQWEQEGKVIEKNLLPSFCYLASKKEIKNKTFELPFYTQTNSCLETGSFALGRSAQSLQEVNPSRVISSAKSWLCHSGVDREDKILPWSSDDIIGDQRYSPVEIQSFILLHLRLYWNATLGKHSDEYKLEKQKIVITVPASFDEIASNLTLKAALKAGFKSNNLSLIEEPQAAFYFWLNRLIPSKEETGYQKQLSNLAEKLTHELPGIKESKKNVLVCDIGGGTCDFSLFTLSLNPKIPKKIPLDIKRIRVSQHILLGGDNIDLKIASLFEKKYKEKNNKSFSSKQWAQVVSSSRNIKEAILLSLESSKGKQSQDQVSLSICDDSRNLFQSSQTISLQTNEISEIILESFFPHCNRNTIAEKTSPDALKEWNLPYAKNPAFSHHLAEFLDGQAIDGVLFVGGTLIPKALRTRLCDIINRWQTLKPHILNQEVFALSVSKGASLYGQSLLDTNKISISAGYPRSLYLEVEKKTQDERIKALICIISKGYENKTDLVSLDGLDLKLAVNSPVTFNLYYSNKRPQDKIGDVVALDYKLFNLLAPIQTKIEDKLKKKNSTTNQIDIFIQVGLTATGLLQVFCCEKIKPPQALQNKWSFDFNVQDSHIKRENPNLLESTDNKCLSPKKPYKRLENTRDILLGFYGKTKIKKESWEKPKASKILRDFEELFDLDKQKWDLQILRQLVDCLIRNQNARGRTSSHESSWYNLCGYFLRPGYGHSIDSMRIQDLWPLFLQGIKYQETSQVQNEWWVFWRRIAGGLTKEQQNKIFTKVFPHLKNKKASAEMIMILGSLELLETSKKILLGNYLVDDLTKGSSPIFLEQKFWALTRTASRHPLYSGPENIIRPVFLEKWLDCLTQLPKERKNKYKNYLHRYYLYSGRIIGDREFDLDNSLREKYQEELKQLKIQQNLLAPLTKCVPLKTNEKKLLLGDSLPPGLLLN